MVSIQPPHEANNINYAQEIQDLHRSKVEAVSSPPSILGLLQDNKDFSIFYHLVIKGQLDGRLNDLQANYTLFVPSNEFLISKYPTSLFTNMDIYTAKEIVLYHLLPGKISYQMLQSSGAMYLTTMINDSNYARVLSETCPPDSSILLNNSAKIKIGNITRNNGLIHVIDNMLFPPTITANGRFGLKDYVVC